MDRSLKLLKTPHFVHTLHLGSSYDSEGMTAINVLCK